MKETALALFKNKWFWIALAAIIVLILVWKNQNRIKGWFSQIVKIDGGDYTEGIGDTETVNATPQEVEAKKKAIEDLARETYSNINGLGFGAVEVFAKILLLNDSELKYLSNFYKTISPNESLKDAIDNEVQPFTDQDELIITRLNQINE
jgi:hypothetical protein